MLKKFKKIAFCLIYLTLYLNIGWGLGYYLYYNVDTKTFESASWHAKLLGGHCVFFAKDEIAAKEIGKHNLFLARIACSVFWPFVLLFSLFFWMGHIVFWVLKFIFWGGLVRLIFGIP